MDRTKQVPWIVCIALVALTLIPYAQVSRFDFLHFDDNEYVYDNPNVASPFSFDTVRWAFTSGYFSNWHPLTWLSHKLDYNLFGLHAGAHHVVNVAFHVLNTLLLFELLRRMTKNEAVGRSALVAALFAIHPLHVESVAWISERKDVLSTFFGFLAMLAYASYAHRPGIGRYVLVLIPFALSLMAKSMLITLPCVLLLLDYWPLDRLVASEDRRLWKRRVIEKIPLFAMALGAGLIAMRLKSLQQFPFAERIGFTLVSYVSYVKMTLWPFGLAAHYPFPKNPVPLSQSAAAAVFLLVVSVLVLLQWRKRPFLLMGWLWFLGILFPVSGIVQVGNHVMADRYTYVPLIGLFIMAVWSGGEVVSEFRWPRSAVLAVCGMLLAGLTVATAVQVHYWCDTKTLMEHAIRVTENNCLAHYDLGMIHLNEGRFEDAVKEFQAALQTDANDDELLANLLANQGVALSALGRYTEALPSYHAALTLRPDHLTAQLNLGVALTAQGDLDEAVMWLNNAVYLSPDNADAHYNLGLALYKQDKFNDAVRECLEALRLRPTYIEAAYCLGLSFENTNRLTEAADVFTKVLQLKPDHSGARRELDRIRSGTP